MAAVTINGFVAPGFEVVRDVFAQNFANEGELGAGFAVIRAGEVLVDLCGGFADRAQTQPFSAQTLVPVYSVTKAAAALAIACVVDRGALSYDQPVADLWPAFGAHGKDRVTVGQALSHQAGVPGFVEPIDPNLWFDPPALGAALAAQAPLWPPGADGGYHPVTFGYIVDEIAVRATGRSLAAILREIVTGPAQIDFHIGLAHADDARVCDIVRPKAMPDFGALTPAKRAAFLSRWSAPERDRDAWRRLELPAINGHGGALSVAQLFSAFANGGVIGDTRVCSADGIAAAMAQRWSGQDLVLPFAKAYGAGLQRNNAGVFGPNPNTVAHPGWGGSVGLADPDAHLACAYVMNKQSSNLQGDPRASRLIQAVYAAL